MADVQDLFRERLDPSGTHAEFRGAQEPLRVVHETIARQRRRAGDDRRPHLASRSADLRRHQREQRRVDAMPDAGAARAARVPLDGPRSPTTRRSPRSCALNEARNWTSSRPPCATSSCPSQNFVYADVDGHIGYYAPGRFPIRASGDGSTDAEGWTGEAEWTGWIPFDALPHAFDPPDHFIVTANDKPVPAGYRVRASAASGPSRTAHNASSICCDRQSKLTPDDFASIQADTFSLHAKALLPVAARARRIRWTPAMSRPSTMSATWNLDAARRQRGRRDFSGVVLTSCCRQLLRRTRARSAAASYEGSTALVPSRAFCRHTLVDSRTTPGATTSARRRRKPATAACCCAARRPHATDGAARRRHDCAGDGMPSTRPCSPIPPSTPWRCSAACSGGPLPHGGDWSTVNVGPVFAPKPFEQHSLPGYRQIVDLSPANDSRFLDAVGQSGHLLSPHYDDALPLWAAGRHRKMLMDRAAIEKGAQGRLRLTPK